MNQNEEDRTFLYQGIFSMIAEQVKSKQVDPKGIGLIDPENRIRSMLQVRPTLSEPGEYQIVMGSIIPGTNALVSCAVFWGNLEEIYDWLVDPQSIEVARKTFRDQAKRCLDD